MLIFNCFRYDFMFVGIKILSFMKYFFIIIEIFFYSYSLSINIFCLIEQFVLLQLLQI